MNRIFWLTASGCTAMLAGLAALSPCAAAPMSMSSAAFAAVDFLAVQVEPVASRPKAARKTAQSRTSRGGVQTAPSDLNGDGTPDAVVSGTPKPATASKPTGRSPSGGVYVN